MTEKDSKEPFIPADERGDTIPKPPDWVLDAIAQNGREQLPVQIQRPNRSVPWMESVKDVHMENPYKMNADGKLEKKNKQPRK